MTVRRSRNLDLVLLLLVFAGSLILYVNTLAPTIVTVFDDSPEFQLVCHLLGVAHPTGYPLYTLLGKFFTLLPLGDIAYRINFMSAFFAALTAGMLALLVCELTGRRLAGTLAALALVVSPVFWSQATIAEVYPLFLFLTVAILWHLTRWENAGTLRPGWLVALAVICGLALTHHRMVALFAPGIAVVILLAWKRWLPAKQAVEDHHAGWPMWWKPLLAGLIPLAFYLYIPLIGARVGSLDGAYQNTFAGFFRHVLALDYGTFLTDNPLAQSRDFSFYVDTLIQQFGLAGTLLGLAGWLVPWRRRRIWAGTLISLVICALFAMQYQVADIEVFLLPVFLLWALGIGMALGEIQNLPRRWKQFTWQREAGIIAGLVALIFIVQPIAIAVAEWPAMDRSEDWGVSDAAVDILTQPLPERATIIGILGETTVLHYLQETKGIRPDVQLIAADREPERMAAVEQALAQQGEAFLTRSLAGVEQYHLDSVGPLIRIQPQSNVEAGGSCQGILNWQNLCLESYETEIRNSHSTSTVRVTLQWHLLASSSDDARFSLRLSSSDGRQVAQHDGRPVHETYPISAWAAGDHVTDEHDLLLPPGTLYGDYTLELVIYNPETGEEFARSTLGQVTLTDLAASTILPAPDALQTNTLDNIVWGRSLELLGHSIFGETHAPGHSVPLEFLWQSEGLADDLAYTQVWLVKDEMPIEQSFDLAYINPNGEQAHQTLVRQRMDYVLPANLTDGVYELHAGVLDGTEARQSAPAWIRWLAGATGRKLGQITVKGRERVYDLPATAHQLQVAFGPAIELRGWEIASDMPTPGDDFTLRLIWVTQSELEHAYSVFVHLTDENNAIVLQQDSPPGAGTLPTTSWVVGEVIDDQHTLTLPAELPSGRYTLRIGLYDPLTSQRLPVAGDSVGIQPDHIILKEMVVP